MRKISLIFTRDYDQWIQEMWRNSLVLDCKKLWGKSHSDQIIKFNGRTFECFRYSDESRKVWQFVIRKKLSDRIFTAASHDAFLQNIKEFRKEIAKSSKQIKNPSEHLDKLKTLFREVYPYYPLGLFIPGPWRQKFLEIHGTKGEKVLRLLTHSREKSEGTLKLLGLHLRTWLGPILQKHGYPCEYVKLLSVKEADDLVGAGSLPPKKDLQRRARGYVYFKNEIIATSNFKNFLTKNKLSLDNIVSNQNDLSGSVAFGRNDVLTGRVQIIMNSEEVKTFKAGGILVTPMTSPEYLPAMKKAKAIITDEGGITCHAAITARELMIPTVIGTRLATKLLEDGDVVKVNVKNGVIIKL